MYTFVFTLLFFSTLCCVVAQPKIRLSVDSVLFLGKIAPSVHTIPITVYNKGNADLEITDISASCGCTFVPLTNKTILPKDSAQIELTFDVTKYTGERASRVDFVSNDPNRSIVSMYLQGIIEREITVEPEKFPYIITDSGSTVTSEVLLVNESSKDITIKSERVSLNGCEVKLHFFGGKIIKAHNTSLVQIEVSTKSKGSFLGFVELNYNGSTYLKKSIIPITIMSK